MYDGRGSQFFFFYAKLYNKRLAPPVNYSERNRWKTTVLAYWRATPNIWRQRCNTCFFSHVEFEPILRFEHGHCEKSRFTPITLRLCIRFGIIILCPRSRNPKIGLKMIAPHSLGTAVIRYGYHLYRVYIYNINTYIYMYIVGELLRVCGNNRNTINALSCADH